MVCAPVESASSGRPDTAGAKRGNDSREDDDRRPGERQPREDVFGADGRGFGETRPALDHPVQRLVAHND